MTDDNLKMMKGNFLIDKEKVMPCIMKTRPASQGINDYTRAIATRLALSTLMQQPKIKAISSKNQDFGL